MNNPPNNTEPTEQGTHILNWKRILIIALVLISALLLIDPLALQTRFLDRIDYIYYNPSTGTYGFAPAVPSLIDNGELIGYGSTSFFLQAGQTTVERPINVVADNQGTNEVVRDLIDIGGSFTIVGDVTNVSISFANATCTMFTGQFYCKRANPTVPFGDGTLTLTPGQAAMNPGQQMGVIFEGGSGAKAVSYTTDRNTDPNNPNTLLQAEQPFIFTYQNQALPIFTSTTFAAASNVLDLNDPNGVFLEVTAIAENPVQQNPIGAGLSYRTELLLNGAPLADFGVTLLRPAVGRQTANFGTTVIQTGTYTVRITLYDSNNFEVGQPFITTPLTVTDSTIQPAFNLGTVTLTSTTTNLGGGAITPNAASVTLDPQVPPRVTDFQVRFLLNWVAPNITSMRDLGTVTLLEGDTVADAPPFTITEPGTYALIAQLEDTNAGAGQDPIVGMAFSYQAANAQLQIPEAGTPLNIFGTVPPPPGGGVTLPQIPVRTVTNPIVVPVSRIGNVNQVDLATLVGFIPIVAAQTYEWEIMGINQHYAGIFLNTALTVGVIGTTDNTPSQLIDFDTPGDFDIKLTIRDVGGALVGTPYRIPFKAVTPTADFNANGRVDPGDTALLRTLLRLGTPTSTPPGPFFPPTPATFLQP
jgi:hypothetical protein